MSLGSLSDFLIRAVLDEAFRELAVADPKRAFNGYDLSEQEKVILTSRDSRLLGLLGDAMTPGEPAVGEPQEGEHVEASVPAVPNVPEVKLLLRLVPQAVQSPDSEPKVAYVASLHPWTGDDEPKSGAEPNEQRKGDAAAGQELHWVIRVVPALVTPRSSGLEVAYSASIHPRMNDLDHAQSGDHEPSPQLASPPWNHHLESTAAKAAARAVRIADPGRRYARLLDLIHALQTGDDRA